MSRSFDSRRRYVRSSKSIVDRARQAASDPAALAGAAGRADTIERATIELLEPRKLLFSVTIDSGTVDSESGLGFASGVFGYFIPYLDSDEAPDDFDPNDIVDEDFNDEDAGPVFNNNVFDGSDILFLSQGTTTSRIDSPGGDNADDLQLLDVTITGTGSFVAFATPSDPMNTVGPRNVSESVTFTVGSSRGGVSFGNGQGLLNGQLEVELRFNGRVVDTFTQADLQVPNPGDATYTLAPRDATVGTVFDEVRFVQRAPADGDPENAADFFLDDLAFSQPAGNFVDLIESRVFGVSYSFLAPEGATIEFLDLYGRDIVETIQLGVIGDTNFAQGDANDDGRPEFNDGIGRINITGTDQNSGLILTGMVIESFTGAVPDGADFVEGNFFAQYTADLSYFDDFQDAGFGFALDQADEPEPTGLPEAGGSVIIGSPFVRPLTNYDPGGVASGDRDFSRDDQGVFINDGSAFGQLITNAAMFGSSNFSGSLGQFSSALFLGSASVAGDLGQFYVATDAGLWVPDPDADFGDDDDDFDFQVSLTGSQLVVGRTLGEYAVAARNQVDIIVDGDLSSPGSAPPDDVLVYDEREVSFQIDLATQEGVEATVQNAAVFGTGLAAVETSSAIGTIPAVAIGATLFGDTYLRNDTILNAEYIGGPTSTVILRGSVGGQDPINTSNDNGDVFAFAADGSTEVVLESLGIASNFRVVDIDGRTVAAASRGPETGLGQVVRFMPDAPGVYYIVINSTTGDNPDEGIDFQYALLVSGIAPTTFGSYRVGLGGGSDADNRPTASDGQLERPTISVLSGSIGSVRIGTNYVDASGQVGSSNDLINTRAGDGAALNASGITVTTPDSLYSFVAGADINASNGEPSVPVTLTVGRDLGAFHTGGDAGLVRIETGGRVGLIDIGGSIATDTAASLAQGDAFRLPGDTFIVRTGLDDDLSGDIGLITVGGSVLGDSLTIDTTSSPGAVVGGILVNQNFLLDGTDDDGFYDGLQGINLLLGEDSDVRFIDTPQIDLLESQSASLPIILGQTLELVDDAGGRVEIRVTQDGTFAQNVGQVIVIPADSGEGVVIARIEVDLTGNGNPAGGRTLSITGASGQSIEDVISIGRIVVTASDAGSRIDIGGPAQIDVWRIDAPQGLDRIENRSAGGDIVAVDTLTLDTLRIQSGTLGRTQVPEFGPRLIGPVLGIAPGLQGEVGAALGFSQLNGVNVDSDWNGQIYRPTTDSIYLAGNAYLSDIGSPFDDALNGVVIRSGSVSLVESNGAVGDVITQGADGDILLVRANADDSVNPDGQFEGIIGSIFAGQHVFLVEVGDGMLRSETGTDSPFAETGIYAEDYIGTVRSTLDGAVISSNIIASAIETRTVAPPTSPFASFGIDLIDIDNGTIDDSFIGVVNIESFYIGTEYGDEGIINGQIRLIDINGGDLFRTTITAGAFGDLRITNGFYDASELSATAGVAGTLSADGFRNSTLDGEVLEFRQSRISVGQDLERLTVNNMGTFADTQLTVLGDIESGFTAANLVRAEIEVANTIRSLIVSDSVLASSITAGQLIAMTVTDTIQLSEIAISGPIVNLMVQNEVQQSTISVTGPDGRIDMLTVMNDLDADISSSGRIGTIQSTMGSITGSIVTTTDRGDINQLSAAVDIATETDIGGDLNQVQAGRNIGDASNPSVILVRGNLTALDVSGGRLFSDLRVGGQITQGVTIGSVVNLPTQPKSLDGDITAFGRIATIDITGDFDGVITSESGGIGAVTITDGSLLVGGGVFANDGGLGSVSIVRGHLLGNIFAEQSINLIEVIASADGSFGDIGINNRLSSGVGTDDPNRNQLPPTAVATAGVDGPVIASMRGINTIRVTGGDIIEATIYAQTFIGLIDVSGGVRSNEQAGPDETTVIAAGDLIQSVRMTGSAEDVLFLAGVTSFGDQPISDIASPLYTDRAGGTGDEADTIKSGRIESVTIGGQATDVRFSAGMTAGNDGVYNTNDAGEGNVVGFSFIDQISIAGAQNNVTFNADRGAVFLNGVNQRSVNAGATSANADGLLAPLNDAFVGGSIDLGQLGTVVARNTTQTFNWNGTAFTVRWNAPAAGSAAEANGQGVIFDASSGTLILANTRIDHEVIVTVLDNDADAATALPRLTDFNIRSNDEASIGLLRIVGENGTAVLNGNSNIVVDNFVRRLELPNVESTGRIVVGADIDTLSANRIAGTSVQANFVRTTTIATSLVSLNGTSPSFDYTGAGSINVAQNATARVNIDRTVTSVDIGGTANGFLLRSGGSLFSFEANEVSRSRLSVANVIGTINVAGDVFDTAIIAGGDLGTDLADGDGDSSSDIDRVTSGTINTVNIGGDFVESDLVAGFLRGTDRFFGTADDAAAAGNSVIGMVTIAGDRTGSNVNSESYAIRSAGEINMVMIGGDDAETTGNFFVGPITTVPLAIQVESFSVVQDARTYSAFFSFNQAIDESSFVDALQIRQVRNETDAQQPFDPADPLSLDAPTPGVAGSGDYSISYDEDEFIFEVTIDRAITDRDLVDNGDGTFSLPDAPTAGVYRFELLSEVLRGLNAAARLDGDNDGFAEVGDRFTEDAVVGDAGDVAGPREAERVEVSGPNGDITIDFFEAVDLDLLLDSNRAPDGLAEINTATTIRGALGDHPDRDLNLFGFGGDRDVYSLTLQAGQILRLGEVNGAASQLNRSVYFQPTDGSDPVFQIATGGLVERGGETAQSIRLPSNAPSDVDIGTDSALLIKQTGVYYIIVESANLGDDAVSEPAFNSGIVPNTDPQPNQIGNYAFDVEVFDDGNSGFNAGTDAGNGTNIVNAPSVAAFGATFQQNPDSIAPIVIGDYTFRLTPGADGVIGVAEPGDPNDDVVTGTTSDGSIVSTRVFNRLETTVSSSIGDPGVAGQPGEVAADVDIFHLNNFQPIAAGSLMTITVKLADSGADLGTIRSDDFTDFTTLDGFEDLSRVVQFALFETTGSNDAESADLVFSPTDFTSRAGTPNTLIASNGPNRYGFNADGDFFITFVVPPSFEGGNGSYAVYLQGAFQSDYELQIVTQGSATLPTSSQNVLIEAEGGSVDWLGIADSIEFGGFDAGTLGFAGLVDSIDVEEFILSELVIQLNGFFDDIGLDVTFSTNPADFEFEPFSTVFITSDANPVGLLTQSDYGVSERSDPFNTDKEDEAVIFASAYATLGFNPSPDDLEDFIDSVSAGIGRRVGELMGLRLTQSNAIEDAGGDIDILGEESIAFPRLDADSNYIFPSMSRDLASNLSNVDDTGFFLGDQDARALLDTILADD